MPRRKKLCLIAESASAPQDDSKTGIFVEPVLRCSCLLARALCDETLVGVGANGFAEERTILSAARRRAFRSKKNWLLADVPFLPRMQMHLNLLQRTPWSGRKWHGASNGKWGS